MLHLHSSLYSNLIFFISQISNRLLLTHTLVVLPPRLLPISHMDTLLRELLRESDHIPSRVSSYSSGLPLVPSLSHSSLLHSFSFLHIDFCLRLLDSYLLGRWNSPDDEALPFIKELDPEENTRLPSRLVAICAAADIASRDEELRDLRPIGM